MYLSLKELARFHLKYFSKKMKNSFYFKFLYSLLLLTSPKAQALVFDVDKRLDFYEIKTPAVQELAKSVFTFIPKEKLLKKADGQFEFTIKSTLKDTANLCPNERFSSQPSVGTRCSGFLASSTRGVTAGHCVSPVAIKDFCKNYYIIFDYRMTSANETPQVLSASSVHECSGISKIAFDPSASSDDYAVIEFSKPVTDRKPLAMRTKGKIKDHAEIFMLGFPRGMPEKISFGRNVIENKDPSYFSTNLDCFHGNSGSPVFDSKSLLVEGIFVRGEGDIPNNSEDPNLVGDFFTNSELKCNQTLICNKTKGCKAKMDATRITRISF